MSRTTLTVINPDAELAPGAEWVSATNVIGRGAGGFQYAGAFSFQATNLGAYDFYQDVAVPVVDYAQVDAGLRTVDWEAYGAMVGFASTMTLYLLALDGGGATLRTWTTPVPGYGKPYTHAQVSLKLLPALTRTLRFGWSGVNGGAGGGWADGFALALDDQFLMATKAISYVGLGAGTPGRLTTTKAISYVIFAPALRQTQRIKVRLISVPMATA